MTIFEKLISTFLRILDALEEEFITYEIARKKTEEACITYAKALKELASSTSSIPPFTESSPPI